MKTLKKCKCATSLNEKTKLRDEVTELFASTIQIKVMICIGFYACDFLKVK